MKNILISEKQLEDLVKTLKESPEDELDEGFLGDLGRDIGTLSFGNIFAGIKGAFKGKGYNLGRSMNIVKNSLKKIKRTQNSMLAAMKELKHVEVEFSELESNDPVVYKILNNLRNTISYYDGYKTSVTNLDSIIEEYYKSEKEGKKDDKSSFSSYEKPVKTFTLNPKLKPDTTEPKKDEPSVGKPDTTMEKNKLEDYFYDWISGMYKLDGDDLIYYLTARKTWEVRKPGGNFNPLKETFKNKEDYNEKLKELKNAKRV